MWCQVFAVSGVASCSRIPLLCMRDGDGVEESCGVVVGGGPLLLGNE